MCAKLSEAIREKFQHMGDKQLYGSSNQLCMLTKVKTFGPSKFQPRETSGCDDQVTSNIKTAYKYIYIIVRASVLCMEWNLVLN